MILADTGFWLALAGPADMHHARALQAARDLAEEDFVCTWPVITETVYLIGKRLGIEARLRFMAELTAGVCTIQALPDTALRRMELLMRRYRNLPMDLADASLVVLAEELGEGRILSTDTRDFGAYRWKNTKPFTNLLLPEPT
ncbi:MAG: DNA-binding protein [Pseudomonadota bacterium]